MCRSRVLPGLGCIYKQDENAIPGRGKTEPCAHKFNSEFEFRSSWPGARTIRKGDSTASDSRAKEGSNGGDWYRA